MGGERRGGDTTNERDSGGEELMVVAEDWRRSDMNGREAKLEWGRLQSYAYVHLPSYWSFLLT